MKKLRFLALWAAAAVVALAAGCTTAGASPAREIRITATEMKFEPAVIEVKAGERVRFTVENKGREEHEFESEQLKFEELEIPPGKTRSVDVTMPERAGEYEFFCDAPGHLDQGMKGKIVVRP